MPSQARAHATVEAILEAATHILKHDGLGSLNTNRIAEKAGVSVGSLYQYFPTKEAILTEIIRRKRSALLAGLSKATSNREAEDLDVTFKRLINSAIDHQFNWPKLARTLQYAEAFLPLGKETDDLNGAIISRISEVLKHNNIKEPDIAAQDIVAIARGIIEAAGLAGETDRHNLFERVLRATSGYLD